MILTVNPMSEPNKPQYCRYCQGLLPALVLGGGIEEITCLHCGNTVKREPLKTTLTIDPEHIKQAMLDLCEAWEKVAGEYRERAPTSKSTDGKPNGEVCRSIAVGLEQCARDVKRVIGNR